MEEKLEQEEVDIFLTQLKSLLVQVWYEGSDVHETRAQLQGSASMREYSV